MKRIEDDIGVKILNMANQYSKALIEENNKPEQGIGIESRSFASSPSRVTEIEDKFTPSLEIEPLATYKKPQTVATHTSVVLPNDYSYLNSDIVKNCSKNVDIKVDADFFQYISDAIKNCEHLDDIVYILKFIKENEPAWFKQSMIVVALNSSTTKIQSCKYLADEIGLKVFANLGVYEEGKLPKPFFTIKKGEKDGAPFYYKLSACKPLNQVDQNTQIFFGKGLIGRFACLNNDIVLADKAFRSILSKDDIFAGHSANDNDSVQYSNLLDMLCGIMDYLTPEYQAQYISKYRDHIRNTAYAALKVSSMLTSNHEYELLTDIFNDVEPTWKSQGSRIEVGKFSYNVAKANISLFRLEEALPYALKGYGCMPEEPNHLEQVLVIATRLKQNNLILELLNSLPDTPLRLLEFTAASFEFIIDYPRLDIYFEKINSIKDSDIPKEQHSLLYHTRFLMQQAFLKSKNSGVVDAKQFRSDFQAYCNHHKPGIVRIVAICAIFGQFDLQRKFLINCDPEIIKREPLLQKLKDEILLYSPII
jgi:hypothetical protein